MSRITGTLSVLTIAAIMTACTSAAPTPTFGPIVESIEGTAVALTTSTPNPIGPAPTTASQAAIASPAATDPVITSPTATTQIGVSPPSATVPIGGSTTSTLISTAPPGATRTPLPTVNLTPLPTLTPRAPTATPDPTRPGPTSSPTPSRTPAATAIPACRPAAQRPPSDAGWTVDNVCLYFEKDTSWIVFGELTNNTGSDLSLVEVGVTFFDGNGTQLAQESSYIDAETMPNGATLPFYIPIDSLNPPAQVGFSITPGDFADLTSRRDLVLSGLQLMPVGNELFLTGQVQNPGPALTDFAEVIATFYDQNGAVVALGYEFLDPLDASETVAFEVPADGLLEFVTDFRVVVYGY